MQRREIAGAVVMRTLSANISNSASFITISDNGDTFPTGATNPFTIVIDRGLADEEKILISSRSGNTLTVHTRGFDGTTAVAHTAGANVDHILDANAVQSMNTTVFDTSVLYWMGV